MTRLLDAWTRARAPPPAAGCFWSTPYRTWCVRTPRLPERRSRHISGLTRRPGRMADAGLRIRGTDGTTVRYSVLELPPAFCSVGFDDDQPALECRSSVLLCLR